jgi:hypothetical protein
MSHHFVQSEDQLDGNAKLMYALTDSSRKRWLRTEGHMSP